jgi:putative IMPACT (imprinted ancient) family translation regulator
MLDGYFDEQYIDFRYSTINKNVGGNAEICDDNCKRLADLGVSYKEVTGKLHNGYITNWITKIEKEGEEMSITTSSMSYKNQLQAAMQIIKQQSEEIERLKGQLQASGKKGKK